MGKFYFMNKKTNINIWYNDPDLAENCHLTNP